MFESIALSIVANFLTDFIKKVIGASDQQIFSPLGEPPSMGAQLSPHDIQKKRRYNKNRRDVALAALVIMLNLFVLICVATILPILLKGINGSIDFEDTRTSLPYRIGIFPFALSLITIFYFPSFYIIQKITQYVVGYVHHEWSDVDRSRAVRFFIGCCFIWLPIYDGVLLYWLFPTLSVGEAIGYPIGAVIAVFLCVMSRR